MHSGGWAAARPRWPPPRSDRQRQLEAPHRRGKASPRIVERAAVAGYRGTTWLLGVLPAAVGRAVIGRLSQASYLAWPAKRRWSNQNFGHVLGLPPDDPRVRRLALHAYREYGRYLVELECACPGCRPSEVSRLAGSGCRRHPCDLGGCARGRADPGRRSRRQQRGRRSRDRPPRAADQRRRRRLGVPGDVRAAPAPARELGRPDDRVAQPARDLRRAQAPRDARPAGRLGLPERRDPGPAAGCLDDDAGRSGHPGGKDRLAHPADRDQTRASRWVRRLVGRR